jgi:hypothetical protein
VGVCTPRVNDVKDGAETDVDRGGETRQARAAATTKFSSRAKGGGGARGRRPAAVTVCAGDALRVHS